jgi:hypothetical protein
VQGNFHLPAPGIPEKNLDRVSLLIGAEQGLGGEFAQGIANEDSADGNRHKAGMVSKGSLGDILNGAVTVTIPARQRHRRPASRRMGSHLLEGAQT